MKNNKIRQTIFTLLLLIISVLFSLAALEVSTRLYLFGWSNLSVEKIKSVRYIGESGLIEASPYPEVVFEFKKNLDAYYKLASLKTNSVGLRDKEYTFSKPENTFRIAIIGDSVAAPAGVEIEDAFHSLLEERLSNEGEMSYEFINFGVPGYNLRQYLGVMENKAVKYDPDLFLIGFIWNDVQVPPAEMFETPFLPKRTADNFSRSFALKLSKRLFSSGKAIAKSNMHVSPAEAEYLDGLFYRIKKFGVEHDTPVLVVFLSIREKEGIEVIEDKIRKHGLFFYDAASSIRGSTDYKIYPIDDHPNAEANSIYADKIYDFLIEEKLVPLSR